MVFFVCVVGLFAFFTQADRQTGSQAGGKLWYNGILRVEFQNMILLLKLFSKTKAQYIYSYELLMSSLVSRIFDLWVGE